MIRNHYSSLVGIDHKSSWTTAYWWLIHTLQYPQVSSTNWLAIFPSVVKLLDFSLAGTCNTPSDNKRTLLGWIFDLDSGRWLLYDCFGLGKIWGCCTLVIMGVTSWRDGGTFASVSRLLVFSCMGKVAITSFVVLSSSKVNRQVRTGWWKVCTSGAGCSLWGW